MVSRHTQRERQQHDDGAEHRKRQTAESSRQQRERQRREKYIHKKCKI